MFRMTVRGAEIYMWMRSKIYCRDEWSIEPCNLLILSAWLPPALVLIVHRSHAIIGI